MTVAAPVVTVAAAVVKRVGTVVTETTAAVALADMTSNDEATTARCLRKDPDHG